MAFFFILNWVRYFDLSTGLIWKIMCHNWCYSRSFRHLCEHAKKENKKYWSYAFNSRFHMFFVTLLNRLLKAFLFKYSSLFLFFPWPLKLFIFKRDVRYIRRCHLFIFFLFYFDWLSNKNVLPDLITQMENSESRPQTVCRLYNELCFRTPSCPKWGIHLIS